MPKQAGAFTTETAKMILEVIEYLRRAGFIPAKGQKHTPPPPSNITYIYLTPGGGIEGRQGNKVFYAECTPYFINEDDELEQRLDNEGQSQTHKIYHIFESPVGGNTYIQAKRGYGRWVTDSEDCG